VEKKSKTLLKKFKSRFTVSFQSKHFSFILLLMRLFRVVRVSLWSAFPEKLISSEENLMTSREGKNKGLFFKDNMTSRNGRLK